MNRPVRRWLALLTLLALLLTAAGAAAPIGLARSDTSTRVAGINIDARTIPQLEHLMDRHRLTSVQLVQFYLHRIAKLNPKLHAVITVSPKALADARAADRARRHGDRRPLLGIPVIVKDNVDTSRMPTTAGSYALNGSRPSDAFIVQQMRAAGAIIIAKANLSEWANFRSIPSSSGWSGIGGQTNMPYVLDRNPCGSSSGTGVGVAADLATVAKLEAEGATIVDPTRIPIEPAYGPEFDALKCEFKSDIAGYLAAHTTAGYPKTLQDLIDFNNAHPNLEGPWNSQLFVDSQATGGRASAECVAARQQATSIAQAAIDDTLAANNLDAIIAPTNGPAWVTNSDPTKGDLDGNFSLFVGSSSPSAIAGYATITVPAGYVGPLPIGVSFIGGRWDEPKLIGLAYAWEQATHVRVPPRFLASTTLAAAGAAVSSQATSGATTARPSNLGQRAMAPTR